MTVADDFWTAGHGGCERCDSYGREGSAGWQFVLIARDVLLHPKVGLNA